MSRIRVQSPFLGTPDTEASIFHQFLTDCTTPLRRSSSWWNPTHIATRFQILLVYLHSATRCKAVSSSLICREGTCHYFSNPLVASRPEVQTLFCMISQAIMWPSYFRIPKCRCIILIWYRFTWEIANIIMLKCTSNNSTRYMYQSEPERSPYNSQSYQKVRQVCLLQQ